jgi:RNA polymerase sigma-70 factor (ECF subfamily)
MGAITMTADADVTRLVRSAAKGDEVAFARIVAAYHEDMRRVCTFVTRDPGIADDACQAAWSIAWRKLGSIREPSRLRPWLVRVAVNEARKQLRSRGRRAQVESLAARMSGSRGVDPETGIDSLDLRAALARLGDREPFAHQSRAGGREAGG